MATHAEMDIPRAATSGKGSLTALVDRWIYVFMAAFLIVVVLVGFIPDSMMKIEMVAAGERPPFPLVMHVHAVLMGSWMLLLLTQTVLMATGRRGMHMQLGVAGMVLAPALVIAGVVLVPENLRSMVDFSAEAPPAVQEQVQGFLQFMSNIALMQLRTGFCFLLLVYLALRAGKTNSGLHKRLMILATIVPMPAAIDRMAFLYHSLPESPMTMHLWPLLCIAPMFLWDLYRQRGIHQAYWVYALVMVPTSILASYLWNSPWWLSQAPGLLYGG